MKSRQEKLAEYAKKYRQTHIEKIAAYKKKYYQENKKKRIEYSKKYYQTHKEEKAKYYKNRYQVNKERIAEHGKNNYEYCKKHHICVKCKTEKALDGIVTCLECRFKSKEQSSEAYNKRNKTESAHKMNIYRKKKTDLLIAFGVCIRCQKRDAEKNRVSCRYCLFENRQKCKNIRMKKGIMPRELMGKGKYCYICGEEVVNNEKLCNKCKDRCTILIKQNSYEYLHGNNNKFREFENLSYMEYISLKNQVPIK